MRRSEGSWERLVLVALILAAAAIRIPIALHHERVDYDEGRYLDNAAHILEGHGFATSTVSHFIGPPPRPPRPEDFSSPLYPYLLAGLFRATGLSFSAAKATNVVLDLACLPLIYLLGRKLFGAAPALIATAGIALQPDQIIVGTWAMTEPIFMLLILLTLLAAAPLVFQSARSTGWGRCAALGLLCGLLYLTRQNGLAVATAVAALVVGGPAAAGESRIRRLILAVTVAAVALAVCAPWFARNAEEFGSATFTRMKNIAWAEEGRSIYVYGQPEPSIQRFVEEHGTAGLRENLLRRAQRVLGALFLSETGPFRWLTLLGMAAPLLPGLRRGAAVVLPAAILSTALLLGVAPWSGAIPRYVLPVRPLFYLAGAAVAWRILAAISSRVPRSAARALLAVAGIGAAAWAFTSIRPVLGGYLAVDQRPARDAALEAAGWIAGATSAGDVLLEGGLLHQYAWIFRRGVVWIPYGDLDALRAVASRYRAGYLAVTAEALRFRPQLQEHWGLAGRSITTRDLPTDLEVVFDRANDGVIIYRIAGAAAAGS